MDKLKPENNVLDEEQVMKIITKVMGMPGVRVDRETLLRKELSKYYPMETIEKAIDWGVNEAEISSVIINRIANSRVSLITNQTNSTISSSRYSWWVGYGRYNTSRYSSIFCCTV